MALTPKEEAMHLEVKALIELKPTDAEALYIYNAALSMFFETNAKEILGILDKHLAAKQHKQK